MEKSTEKYGENNSTLGASVQPAPNLLLCDLIKPVSKVNENRYDRVNDTDGSCLILARPPLVHKVAADQIALP